MISREIGEKFRAKRQKTRYHRQFFRKCFAFSLFSGFKMSVTGKKRNAQKAVLRKRVLNGLEDLQDHPTIRLFQLYLNCRGNVFCKLQKIAVDLRCFDFHIAGSRTVAAPVPFFAKNVLIENNLYLVVPIQ